MTITTATYVYRDEGGEPLFRVVRREPKGFFQQRPDSNGGWINGLRGVRRVPYRLPGIVSASPGTVIHYFEGEKDVDNAAQLGLAATTTPMGAGKWRDDYASHFADRRVAIFPDNDDVGHKHAQDVARSLCRVCQWVRVINLPGLPLRGDFSDWIDAGGTVEELAQLVHEAPVWVTEDGHDESVRLTVTSLVDVVPEEVDWLWQGRSARGKLTILGGDPGVGK